MAAQSHPIKTVILIGATGDLGTAILKALDSSQQFSITLLQRQSSTSTPSQPVHIISIPDAFVHDDLVSAFKGQDAVIVCARTRDIDQHNRIATAAATAGVRRFIPADFGSCDPTSSLVQSYVPLFKSKIDVRDHLRKLAADKDTYPGFSWTALVNGHFFDWGLKEDFLHFYLRERRVDFLDGGKAKASYSTFKRIAEATVKIMERESETRNRIIFIQSFCVSQKAILASLERVMGGAKWTVTEHSSQEFLKEHKQKADAGDKEATEDLVFALGTIDADWTRREEYGMELLGLEDEDLDRATKAVIDDMGL